jgi:hypothetical protein
MNRTSAEAIIPAAVSVRNNDIQAWNTLMAALELYLGELQKELLMAPPGDLVAAQARAQAAFALHNTLKTAPDKYLRFNK